MKWKEWERKKQMMAVIREKLKQSIAKLKLKGKVTTWVQKYAGKVKKKKVVYGL